jgi:hypothetical protein
LVVPRGRAVSEAAAAAIAVIAGMAALTIGLFIPGLAVAMWVPW